METRVSYASASIKHSLFGSAMNADMSDALIVRLAGIFNYDIDFAQDLQPGDSFTLLDLGGVFVLSPLHSEIDALAERLTYSLTERGETLETLLQALREEREGYAH